MNEMGKFAIGNQEDWCTACGNGTEACRKTTNASPTSSTCSTTSKSASGIISRIDDGIIGAMVTLAVILGLGGLLIVVGLVEDCEKA